MHLSKEWVCNEIEVANYEKSAAQKNHRKKILKHASSKAHITASKAMQQKRNDRIQRATISCRSHEQKMTEKCVGTAYYIAKENRPYSDNVQLICLQIKNRLDMGKSLHSILSCTKMIDVACIAMKKSLVREIVENENKTSLKVDESTSVAKDPCLIIYLRALINGPPENVCLSIVELQDQDVNSIKDAILKGLDDYMITDDYLARNLLEFTSDGAPVMKGIKKGVATKLKEKYPQIITWHCLNDRLELAIGDAIKSVNGVNQMEAFFSKIYFIYSQSSKMQRELGNIAGDIDPELRKVGRITDNKIGGILL